MMNRLAWFRIDPYFLAGLVAVLIAGGVYLRREAPASPRPDVTHFSPAVAQSLDRLGVGHARGRPDAAVHVVELFDYQCPACAAAHRATAPLLERQLAMGAIRYTVYDLPLPSHGNAIPAALVAGCVERQSPEGFWELRDRLFAEQRTWASAYPAEPPLLRIAQATGRDTAAIRACLASEGQTRVANLRGSWEVASRAGFTFTPAYAVNGKIVPWDVLDREISLAMKGAAR